MRYLHLILRNLLRKKVRTLFTVLSIVVAFVLFGYLVAIKQAFSMGVELTGADRLMMTHRNSIIQPLPISYQARIEQVKGVVRATHASWFGGVYQDSKNFFPQMAVEPDGLLSLYPEYLLPDDQRKAWLADRTGAIAGITIAKKYGWKIGDRIPIQGTVWRPKTGGNTWEFTLDGIYEGKEKGTDTTGFYFRYDFFDEMRRASENYRGSANWFIIRIDDPARAAEIAKAIDATFANSSAETKTATEKAFAQSFANQVGNIGKIIQAIVTAVFFTLLLVAGNTMAQSVRERTSELAVLKTLGFSDGKVLGLVLGESLILVGVAGALGLGLSWWLTSLGDPTPGFLPIFYLPRKGLAIGGAIVLVLGFVAGIVPAVQAMRLSIVDALRRA